MQSRENNLIQSSTLSPPMYPTFIVCNVDCGIDIGSQFSHGSLLIYSFVGKFNAASSHADEHWPSVHLHQDDNSVETIDTLGAHISTKSFPRLIDVVVVVLQVDCTGGII